MTGDVLVWIISFFVLIGLLGILVCLMDLEYNYINSYDTAAQINMLVLTEYFTQGGLCLLLLLTGRWVMALFNLPYLYCNYTMYSSRRHLVDMTEIFNVLGHEKEQRLLKLFYLVVVLLFSIMCMIICSLELEDESYVKCSY